MATLPRSIRWRVDLGQLTRLSTSPDSEAGGRDAQSIKAATDASPSQTLSNERLSDWKQRLQWHRHRYQEEKTKISQPPDEEDSKEEHRSAGQNATGTSQSGLAVNNPLSLADENPWHAHFERLGILEQIRIDVQRVFADEERFEMARAKHVELSQRLSRTSTATNSSSAPFDDQLTSILAIWSLKDQHQDVGYRQGMHEIAALCWLVLVEDLDKDTSDVQTQLLTLEDLEADTYSLFELIMERAKPWYAWRNSSQHPILQHCETIRDSLSAYDVELGKHLDRLGIATQLFAIRWIRLIFTRELSMDVAIDLWGELFHCDPTMDLVNHICVAMLVRIEQQLLAGENPEALRLILSYPKEVVTRGHSLHMLLDEARQVRRRYQAVQSGHEPAPPGSWIASSSPKMAEASNAQASSTPKLSDFARGIYAQSVGASFNKALYNVQHTVQHAYQQAQMQRHDASSIGNFPPGVQAPALPERSPSNRDTNTFASVSSHTAEERLHHLLRSNRSMGVALGDVITILERQHEAFFSPRRGKSSNEESETDARQNDLLLSLTALKHIRDVLSGETANFEAAAVTLRPKINHQQADEGAQKNLESAKGSRERLQSHEANVPGKNSTDKATSMSFSSRFQLAPEIALERSSQSTAASYGRHSPLIAPPSPSATAQNDEQLREGQVESKARKGISDRLREVSLTTKSVVKSPDSKSGPVPFLQGQRGSGRETRKQDTEASDPLGANSV